MSFRYIQTRRKINKMEEVAAELDSKFEDTEKKLDNVSWKVEKLVEIESAGNMESAANLISSVQEIRKEFTSLVQEVQTLKQEQENAMSSILQELKTTMETAEQLQSKLNVSDPPESNN